MAHPLLKLVHSFERRRQGIPYATRMELSAAGPEHSSRVLSVFEREEHLPRAFVVGSGDRVDVSAPGPLLPRHLAVLAVPGPQGVLLRATTLHPDKTLATPQDGLEGVALGAVEGHGELDLIFDGLRLRVSAYPLSDGSLPPPTSVAVFPPGEQLGFYQGAELRPVGNVVASISGPGGGGHAIPALVAELPQAELAGSLVLHGRSGVHRLEPTWRELRRGLLIGRSRRCVIGRGFDENDGLSRVHALCVLLEEGVYVFDLASRYGLRDVARPARLLPSARLDDGTGCLVYGAGHLLFES